MPPVDSRSGMVWRVPKVGLAQRALAHAVVLQSATPTKGRQVLRAFMPRTSEAETHTPEVHRRQQSCQVTALSNDALRPSNGRCCCCCSQPQRHRCDASRTSAARQHGLAMCSGKSHRSRCERTTRRLAAACGHTFKATWSAQCHARWRRAREKEGRRSCAQKYGREHVCVRLHERVYVHACASV